MTKNNIFYGIIVFVLAILMIGSLKYYEGGDSGVEKQQNRGFGITHGWTLSR